MTNERKKKRGKKSMKNKAFTLIELLVVVLIIGILAAIAVPQYQVAVAKSRFSTLKDLTKSIKDAQEIYYLAHDSYATKFEQLDIAIATPLNTDLTYDSNLDQYNYDWGYCAIEKDAVYCEDYKAALEYQLYYDNSKRPGRRVCVVVPPTNETANKVCQQETGTTQYYAGSGYNSYGY